MLKTIGRRLIVVAGLFALVAIVWIQAVQVSHANHVEIKWAAPNNPASVQADQPNGHFDYTLKTTVITSSPVDLHVKNTPGNNENIDDDNVALTDANHLDVSTGEYDTGVDGFLFDPDEDGLQQMSAWESTFFHGAGAFNKTVLKP